MNKPCLLLAACCMLKLDVLRVPLPMLLQAMLRLLVLLVLLQLACCCRSRAPGCSKAAVTVCCSCCCWITGATTGLPGKLCHARHICSLAATLLVPEDTLHLHLPRLPIRFALLLLLVAATTVLQLLGWGVLLPRLVGHGHPTMPTMVLFGSKFGLQRPFNCFADCPVLLLPG